MELYRKRTQSKQQIDDEARRKIIELRAEQRAEKDSLRSKLKPDDFNAGENENENEEEKNSRMKRSFQAMDYMEHLRTANPDRYKELDEIRRNSAPNEFLDKIADELDEWLKERKREERREDQKNDEKEDNRKEEENRDNRDNRDSEDNEDNEDSGSSGGSGGGRGGRESPFFNSYYRTDDPNGIPRDKQRKKFDDDYEDNNNDSEDDSEDDGESKFSV